MNMRHVRYCPTCGNHKSSSTEPFPPFQPIPLTPEVRKDLWVYFGEEPYVFNDGSWPSLPAASVNYPRERIPELLNTPFTRAFLAWRIRGDRS